MTGHYNGHKDASGEVWTRREALGNAFGRARAGWNWFYPNIAICEFWKGTWGDAIIGTAL